MWYIIPMALRYFPPIVHKAMSEGMESGNLEINYVWEGDLLCLWNDLHVPVTGFDITTNTILTAFHSRDGNRECKGFDFYDAAKMLLPFLKDEGEFQGQLCQGELSVSYSCESDALKIMSNRHIATGSFLVAEGLTAHYTEKGWAVGFTLERAAQFLLPHLENWRPYTDEEMVQIQKVIAEHDAAMRERMYQGS